MADKNILGQMLEHLVNDDQAKAEELFHEYVVAKSREIYETLIEAEMTDEEDEDKNLPKDEDGAMEENFEEIAYEAEEDEEGSENPFGSNDQTDNLAGEMDGEEGGEDLSGESEEELFQDLDSIVDELQARFDELKGGDHAEPDADNMGGPSDMDADNEAFEPEMATVREYVEKVGSGHGAEKKGGAEGVLSGTGTQSDKPSVNTKSIVAGKNDMGGTASNIAQHKEDAATYANQGQLKGSGLAKGNTTEENFGNVNVPGGNAGKTGFKTKQPGHGAEKKGDAPGKMAGAGTGEMGGQKGEQVTGSLFRGRR